MITAAEKAFQSTLATMGYRLARTDALPRRANYGLDCLFPLLKQFGFAPRHVLDVGANKGDWTKAAIQYFPEAAYTLVEPQNELKVYVQDLIKRSYKIRWIHAGAADKPGFLPFTIASRDDSSSFAIEGKETAARGFRRTTVEVHTLDGIVSSSGLPVPDMVKIDVEGFDLKVLSGAGNLLGRTEVFFVEAAVRCPYENSVSRVVQHMSDKAIRCWTSPMLIAARDLGFFG